MEIAFITISDSSQDARIRYVSNSIEDLLGYQPHEVINRSGWEFLHPDEISLAKGIYQRAVRQDKAAALNHFRVRHRAGFWVSCECVFTVVCNTLFARTTVCREGLKCKSKHMCKP
ncbi:conserved hypothetical protein [Coccidioides posadasii str. Silveira]|uniref:PAS domain-containing protein n=2 Tax=Coccidioides posadasii TaxID=199306 RepID=E9DII9_COCPS|nr:conserved hypothetical protein [Coccidioides posadasii str. Silveira]KMM69805.1 hypothetical protein CPAG_06118 [Coccidioides posadasii RMSCC 3488]